MLQGLPTEGAVPGLPPLPLSAACSLALNGLAVEGELAAALAIHRRWIGAETLALDVVDEAATDATFERTFEIDGARVGVSLRRA